MEESKRIQEERRREELDEVLNPEEEAMETGKEGKVKKRSIDKHEEKEDITDKASEEGSGDEARPLSDRKTDYDKNRSEQED